MQIIPSEFLAIDRKERANRPFRDLTLRPPEERIHDFNDVVISFDPERAMVEAARCIHCPDPAPCMVACPTHNDIPSAMWLIEQGRFRKPPMYITKQVHCRMFAAEFVRMSSFVRDPASKTRRMNRCLPVNWKPLHLIMSARRNLVRFLSEYPPAGESQSLAQDQPDSPVRIYCSKMGTRSPFSNRNLLPVV
jgi:ferredoxin